MYRINNLQDNDDIRVADVKAGLYSELASFKALANPCLIAPA